MADNQVEKNPNDNKEENNQLNSINENNTQNDSNQDKKEQDRKNLKDKEDNKEEDNKEEDNKEEDDKDEEDKSQEYLDTFPNESNSELRKDIKDDDSSGSDKDDSVNSLDSNDEKYIIERMKTLENPNTFQKKREFFAFYAKHRIRQSVYLPQKKETFKRRHQRMNSQIIEEKPEYKRYNQFELRPRGFGINVKEKIEFFEKKILESQYKPLNLTQYQRKYYDNNQPRKFDLGKLKVINIAKENNNKEYQSKFIRNNYRCSVVQLSFETSSNNKKKKDNKLNLNLNVDYSKILNSAKINKSEKGLDLFMTDNNIKDDFKNNNNTVKINPNKNKKQKHNHNIKLNHNSSDSDSDFFSSIKEASTTTTNTNTRNKGDQALAKSNKGKTRLYNYDDLVHKISAPITLKSSFMSNFNDNLNLSQLKDLNKEKSNKNNNTYVLVKKNNKKMSLEKKSLANQNTGVKKVIYQKVSDNLTLNRLDNAKHKLNLVNNNQKIKRQIIDMLEQLIIDRTNNKCKDKINNKYDKQKLNRAFEIVSKLALIKDKFNSYLESENLYSTNYKSSFNEKTIKQSVSTVYFLECLGLEPIILFNDNEEISNKQFVNDVHGDFQLIGINNRKKYIKYYLQNMNKANYLLELLINKILHLQSDVNKNKSK